MNSGATNPILDDLIPPPGPRWRQIVGWVVFLVLVAAVVTSWRAGAIVPRFDQAQWIHYGGEGPVFAGVVVGNGSPRPIEITRGPDPRPGLVPLGYALGTYDLDPEAGMDVYEPGIDLESPDLDAAALESNPFPLRLDPGEAVVVTVVYDATDCAAIRAITPTDTSIEFQVRMADGAFGWFEHQRQISLVMSTGSWPAEIAQYPCGFADPTE